MQWCIGEQKVLVMKQQISVITIGIADLECSRRFYTQGFGWAPVFENEEIIFYQMNGFVLGTFLKASLETDVELETDVVPLMDRLVGAGGKLVRSADAPSQGGFRGYVADPDDHAWEIAWNPAWAIDENGLVTFGI